MGRLGFREIAPHRNTHCDEGSQVLIVRSLTPTPLPGPTHPRQLANKSPEVECGMFIE